MSEDLSEWRDDRRRKRVADFHAMRPMKLRHKGDLLPAIAEWGGRLFDNTAGNLLLTGPTGTGKSWSSWEVMERALKAGFDGSILMLSQAQWQEIVGPPALRDRLQEMRTVDVLALDDLGSVRLNEWQRELLLPVVDDRWSHGLPTIITTNIEELGEYLGEPIASRLSDPVTPVAVDGDDRRVT